MVVTATGGFPSYDLSTTAAATDDLGVEVVQKVPW